MTETGRSAPPATGGSTRLPPRFARALAPAAAVAAVVLALAALGGGIVLGCIGTAAVREDIGVALADRPYPQEEHP